MPIIKNKDTPQNQQFWSHVEAVAREVKAWPPWMGNRTTRSGSETKGKGESCGALAAAASAGDKKT